jgi:hypothetical protein
LLDDPNYVVQPRYWVAEADVRAVLRDPAASYLLGFRDICRNTDERTMIAAVIPVVAAGHKLPVIRTRYVSTVTAGFLAMLDSFAFDYVARQKVGGTNMAFFTLKQLPACSPKAFEAAAPWSTRETVAAWLAPRVLELTYTAWDLAGFAAELDYHGAPFHWDHDRRRTLRAELDAAFFHLYGYDREDVEYVMHTFPVVRRNDEKGRGEYLTKRLVLERYDALAKASESSEPYTTILDPQPADPSVAHTISRKPLE